ncbi:outer membrane protein assembly factor BamE [Bdellovibrio sp. SKB1291214]|uniref:outer membrane protein assembly factor BamE domain-containing protein n=1 Tax=Bdellovibrio sp. SKB1291214 TaxID=1732569 RepID=UPI000B5197CE|nr:outer membrane protein assembly factor BamE [Bdellovibrio sp. SKB1291214]UYL10333.1 outer membrane protein assembly factor BamE [Bdellovibrio sp. SKB1291214]
MYRLMSIPIVVIGLFTSACQTSMLKQFESIKPGMEKDDVLDLMGSPNQTQRVSGKDRWYYTFYDKRIRFQKEVQFVDNTAIYIGEVYQPPADQTAVAVDARNEERNKSLDEQAKKEVIENRKAYDAYEAQTKGTDKVRYLPTFEPIR